MTSLADIQARRSPTAPAWITWLRWIAVLPVALVVSSFTESLLRALLTAVLGLTVSDIVSPFFVAAVFVMAGSIVAPRRKVETALALIAFNVLVMLVVAVILLSGWQIGWLMVQTRAETKPWIAILATIASIAGLLCGLHWVRKDAARNAARAAR